MPTLQFDRITQIEFPGSGLTPITSEGIVNNTLSLREILCSDRLAFGDINTNQFSCQLYNYQNLTGKKIVVKQVDRTVTPNVTTTIFTGWVDSCKMDDITGFVKVVAYDFFYKARKKKIKGWWNSYWSGKTQSTLGAMWRSMLSYYSVSYTDKALILDDIVIKKNKQNKKLRVKSITSFLGQLCELNMAIPKMSREGVLEFIVPREKDTANAVDIRGMYVLSESKFEDYTVQQYDKVQLYDSNNKLKATAGNGNNLLSVKNNLFLFGQKQEVLQSIANEMFLRMHTFSYIPANITMKVAQLDVKLGDIVRTDKGYSLVCENNYSGPLLVDQSMVSNDENEYTGGSVDSADKETSLGDSVEREDYRLQYEIDNKNSNFVDDLDIADLDDLGIEGDMYTKTGLSVLQLCGIDKNYLEVFMHGEGTAPPSPFCKGHIKNLRWTNKGYQWHAYGKVGIPIGLKNDYSNTMIDGTVVLKLTGLRWQPNQEGHNIYHCHCKISYTMARDFETPWFRQTGFHICDVEPHSNPDAYPSSGGSEEDGFFAYGSGCVVSVGSIQNHVYEYEGDFEVSRESGERGYMFIWLTHFRVNSWGCSEINPYTMDVTEFYVYHENETYTADDIDKMFVNVEKKTENSVPVRGLRSVGIDETEPEREWKEVRFLSDVADGMHLDGKTILLDDNILRAWMHANPPQVDRDYNQLCGRFTGKPLSSVTIARADTATDWSYDSVKKDKEGVYTIKNHGTYTSGSIQQIAYALTGLSVGATYYFNFRADINGAEFGRDFDKGLGVIFSNSDSVNTDAWSGNPHTFDETTLYCSFYRSTAAHYYDFSFDATATTMYMILIFSDVTSGSNINVTLDYFIVSQEERKYLRSLYMYDLVENAWLQYKPFGLGSGDGESEVSMLGELDDVNLTSPADGQVLRYNAVSGDWENKNDYTLPVASAQTLGGIKVGTNLSIDANGVLSATGGGTSDLDAISLTQAQYDVLTPAEKTDPDKLYFITDGQGGGGGGGGGGSTVIVDPLITEGTPIAEITVDGVTQTLYAPTVGQIYDLSSFTKIYDTQNSFGNSGVKTNNILSNANEVTMVIAMNSGWNSGNAAYYDAENKIGAYGGYEFNAALKLDHARFYIGRYSGQNTTLTVTVQYMDSNNNWVDVDDLSITNTLSYPINYFDVALSSVGNIYGLRWIHYKTPQKSSNNNITFFGMLLYR